MRESNEQLNELVTAAREGDRDARDAVLRAVRPAVLRYLLARGRSDAEDLTQEVSVGVLQAIDRWTDTGASFWGLVFTIARNKLTDAVRREARTNEIPLADVGSVLAAHPGAGPQELVEGDEAADAVRRLLDTLPSTQRDVLLLRVIAGLSAAETAGVLGLTVGSVRVTQHRAVTALRRLVGENQEIAS